MIGFESVFLGPEFLAYAGPLLYEPLWRAARAVRYPNPNFATVYDQWLQGSPKSYGSETKPRIFGVGSGSDHVSFVQTLGVSSGGGTFVS